MIFSQWDIVRHEFAPPIGPHPVVIISNPQRAARAEFINVLYCTSQRQSRAPSIDEVLLNGADGLDWETFCRCDHLFSVHRETLKSLARPARVTAARRRQIAGKLIERFQLTSF